MILKTQKFQKKSVIFCRQILGKNLAIRFWSKNCWFYKILEKLKKKKKSAKTENLGQSPP